MPEVDIPTIRCGELVPGYSVQQAEVTHASSGDRQFGVHSQKCDADVGC